MRKIIFPSLLISALLIAACSGFHQSADSPLDAIEAARSAAGFPKLDLVDQGLTSMINSPRGDLQVEQYQDSQGRIFYVEPVSNTVVEIDARTLLDSSHSGGGQNAICKEELADRAEQIVNSIIPEFSTLKDQLRYEPGEKENVHFFSWYGKMAEGASMPPFIQVGLTDAGELFAYYNTVTIGN
jgi:hypothetical protein